MSIQSNFPNLQPSLLLDFANTKQLDNRVTFTRSTPAVYYDGETTAMAEQNLITNSQVFTGAPWVNVDNTTLTGSQTAPDGTSTATKLIPNTSNALHRIFTNTIVPSGATTTWTISIYAKADGYNYLGMFINGPDKGVLYNLSAGTASDTPFATTGATYSITSVGNSWYRCVITVTGTSIINFQLQSWNNTPAQTFAGDGTSGVIIWGAQIEARSTATAYTVTTTQPITNYIPVLLSAGGNQPRFDCNPTTGESLGLLIEEQRTNLVSYSSEFSNAYWDKYNLNLNSNTIVAPDGTLTGDKISANTSSDPHYMYPLGGTAVSAGTYTASVYAKAGERTRLIAALYNGSNYAMAQFDLANGTILQEADAGMASITSVGNGWYRCTVKRTIGAITTYFSFAPYVNNTIGTLTGGFPSYSDDGFSGIYVWGAQLEAASFATSYIATTSASATRTADIAVMTGANFSGWYNQAQGTLYGEATEAVLEGPRNIAQLVSTTGPNQTRLYFGNNVAGFGTSYAEMYVQYNSTDQAYPGISGAVVAGTAYRTATAFKVNDFAISANGSAVATTASGILGAFNILYIGSTSTVNGFLNGTIKKIAYYPLRLSNTNLQALTS